MAASMEVGGTLRLLSAGKEQRQEGEEGAQGALSALDREDPRVMGRHGDI